MGPRHFSRGIQQCLKEFCWACGASMEPRHFSRGIPRPPPTASPRSSCFNGAAAFQPRNRSALLPGPEGGLASMGPRHFSRGILWMSPNRTIPALLQWGRGISAAESNGWTSSSRSRTCFNGAAAFQPRNPSTTLTRRMLTEMLQWGRGISAAESASSGPVSGWWWSLQWGRGISAAESICEPDDLCSKITLQWGRGISAAESKAAVEGIQDAAELQWGRGISAAESNRWVVSITYPGSFNGAAAFQPRNPSEGILCYDCHYASMGPRHFSRGILRVRMNLTSRMNASMGPRHFSRGILTAAVNLMS